MSESDEAEQAPKKLKVEEPQEIKLWPSVVYAPLNKVSSLVCGVATFGPIQVVGCVIDGGCTTTLLPWPDDPNAELAALLENKSYQITVERSGAVGSSHASLSILAKTSEFAVVLEGVPVASFRELRLAVTEEARQWLEPRKVSGLPKKDDPVIHQQNMDCALVGQEVLEGLVTLQIGRWGMLLIDMQDYEANPAPANFLAIAKDQLSNKKTTAYYENFLKDLRDRGHQDASDKPLRIAGYGKRMDTLGARFRG